MDDAGTCRCPHCEATEHRTVFSRLPRGTTPKLQLVRCERCKLVYLASWSAPFCDALYDYYAKYLGVDRSLLIHPNTVRSDLRLLDKLAARAPGRRLLDLGCGYGALVDTANRHGWDARGIDLSSAAIQVAHSMGVRCERVDVFDAALDAERFDVITMSEFIEHVPHPGRFFARAEQLLAPGGLLYLTTPNFDSLQRYILREELGWVHQEHLTYFDPSTLRQVVRQSCALVEVELDAKNLAPFVLLRGVRQRLRPAATSASVAPASAAATASTSTRRRFEGWNRADVSIQSLVHTRAARVVVDGINVGLTALGVGDTLTMTLRRTS